MHRINSNNKRSNTVRLFLSYAVIALILTLMTYVLVLVAAGYDIDRKTGDVIQNGVLLLESNPKGSEVYVNGELERSRTPTRLALPQGNYTVKLDNEDYRPWTTDVEISGSKVNWLYHPQLIPSVIETEQVHSVEGLLFAEMNYKADRVVTHTSADGVTLRIHDIDDSKHKPQLVELPAELLSGTIELDVTGELSFVEWADTSDYMLLNYSLEGSIETLLVDVRNPDRSLSIDKSLGFAAQSVFFGPSSNDVYVINAGVLSKFDRSGDKLGAPIFAGVDQYFVGENDVWVLNEGDVNGRNGVYRISKPEEPIISLEEDERNSLIVASYDSSEVIALVGDGLVRIYTNIYDSATHNVPSKIIKYTGSDARVSFSPGGRFVSLMQENDVLVYDLDTKKEHPSTIDSTRVLGWLDDERMYYSKDSVLTIFDFNGSNRYQIVDFDPRLGVFLNEQKDAVYTISKLKSTGVLALKRSIISLE